MSIGLYEAKFSIYSSLKVIEQVWIHASINENKISDEDLRLLEICKEDIRNTVVSDWDLTKL